MTIGDELRAARVQAVTEIAGQVCGARTGKFPTRLASYLFQKLLTALRQQGGDTIAGTPVERAKIAEDLNVDPASGAFKRAMPVIKARLGSCRQCDPAHVADLDDGIAAGEFVCKATSYLVLVDCPNSQDAGSRPWQLRARFSHLDPAVRSEIEATERTLESGLEDLPDFLPQMRIIAEHVRHARARFAFDDRKHLFVNAYAAHVIESSTNALGRLPDGIAATPYADFSLLTGVIARLSAGEELFGLSDWTADRDWWGSSDGQTFIAANQMAIKHGAIIRRIFVTSHDLATDAAEDLQREIVRQRQMGVMITTVAASEMAKIGTGGSQCVLRTRDDGRIRRGWLTYNVRLDDQGHPVENVFSIDDLTITQNEAMLERLWSNGSTRQ